MTNVVSLKLTAAENELLDWLVSDLTLSSRSQVLRHAMVLLARQHSAAPSLLRRVMEHRQVSRPRRSILPLCSAKSARAAADAADLGV